MATYPSQYYQGWDPASAQADWQAKGENMATLEQTRGVTPSGGGATSTGRYVGGVDESQIPSTLDYIEKLNTTEDTAFQDLVMAMKARKSPLDVYTGLEEAAGLPAMKSSAISLSKSINDIEDTLEMIEPDVSAKSRESLMTEAQRRAVVSKEKEPFREKLTKLSTNLGRLKDLIGLTGTEIGTKANLYMQGEEMKLEPIKLQYQALVDRNARLLTGFTSDKQTKLEILMDKINRQRELSDQEWQLANQLSSEQRSYLKQLQTSAAEYGYKVTGAEGADQLLGIIGNKAAEQIKFEREQAKKTGGTSGERASEESKTRLISDAKAGATFKDIVLRYMNELSDSEIRSLYNKNSGYGQATESEETVQEWKKNASKVSEPTVLENAQKTVAQLDAAGADPTDIVAWIKSQGLEPDIFGYKKSGFMGLGGWSK